MFFFFFLLFWLCIIKCIETRNWIYLPIIQVVKLCSNFVILIKRKALLVYLCCELFGTVICETPFKKKKNFSPPATLFVLFMGDVNMGLIPLRPFTDITEPNKWKHWEFSSVVEEANDGLCEEKYEIYVQVQIELPVNGGNKLH